MWIIPLLLIIAVIVIANLVVVPQSKVYVIERLGVYSTTWEAGVHIKIPFIEKIARRVSLKEQVVDFEPQNVITKDNVTIKVDSVVYMYFSDAKLLTYGVENPLNAIENLTATTLRNIIGDLELDETLTSRDTINTEMRAILDDATDAWGIKITRVELKNIVPPRDIQDSMEKQMRAERERREAILQAEGTKQSQILIAQGEKEAAILRAQAEKESAILRADAVKESKIREAEGEAAAILKVQEATALGLRKIKEAGVDSSVIQLRSLETLEKLGYGNSTKIIVPSNIASLAGTLSALNETVKVGKPGESDDFLVDE